MINILILIDCSPGFSRRFLGGLSRYSNENGPWNLYYLTPYYKNLSGEGGILQRIREQHIDAVIVQWEYEDFGFLEKLDIPVFIQNGREASSRFSKIAGSDPNSGSMAARFFIQKGFKNFAFYGNNNFFWSKQRAEGFRREIQQSAEHYAYFESEELHGAEGDGKQIDLNRWLMALPKPVGVFACDDIFALQVAEICKMNRIDIPNEVSLLGIDNDEFICNLSNPPLSSIVIDDEKEGYTAGEMLHRLIREKSNEPFTIAVEPLRIELRQSTGKYAVTDPCVLKVIDYIDENIASCLLVERLTELVPLSRRTLEIRFRKAMGISVHQFIMKQKVDYIARLLPGWDKDLIDIALGVGFKDVRSLFRLFKKYKGCTPVEYRKKFFNK